ncbi:MAG: CHRD domain-containing protein, partial [Acidimicrobiales bacterium]
MSPSGDAIRYRLTFSDLESDATQAHIHFENATNNGPIVVFLCTNLGNGPAGTQACPAAGGTVRGTIRAADVGAGAAAQGIAAGEFDEFVRAIRAGATYVNVHTTGRRPTGDLPVSGAAGRGRHARGPTAPAARCRRPLSSPAPRPRRPGARARAPRGARAGGHG